MLVGSGSSKIYFAVSKAFLLLSVFFVSIARLEVLVLVQSGRDNDVANDYNILN